MMCRKMLGVVFMSVALAVAFGGKAFAQFDPAALNPVLSPGEILISPSFSYGGFDVDGSAITISGAADYVLDMPLTLGAQVGFSTLVGVKYWNMSCLPIFLRLQYHPNIGVDGGDFYATFKLGYNIVLNAGYDVPLYSYDYDFTGGFSYGFNVGYRHWLSEKMGFFGEIGYDRYGLKWKYDGYLGYGGKIEVDSYIYTWLHLGVTFKM